MSEIPEDVMKAAIDIAYSAECGVVVGSFPGAIYIARAILAERMRCAEVAEKRFTKESVIKNAKGEPYITGSAAIYAAERIATAIRGG